MAYASKAWSSGRCGPGHSSHDRLATYSRMSRPGGELPTMAHPIPAIIPTLHGPRRGQIHLAEGSNRAAIFIERAPQYGEVRGTFSELSYYLHNAGCSVLRVAMPPFEDDLRVWVGML